MTATILRTVLEAARIVVYFNQSVYCSIDNRHVIHTVATIVAASTALVGVVVVSVAFCGCCQRGVLGHG